MVNPFTLKNLQNKILFSYMVFLTLKKSLNDHQLLKNNLTLEIDKMKSKEIYSIIILSKVNIPICRIYFFQKYSSIVFNGKTSPHFHAKRL